MKKIWLILGVVFPVMSYGQVDTAITFRAVDVFAPKLRNESVGSQTKTLNTERLQILPSRNVAELLQQESSVFIKNYGSGSIATSSIRGGSAGHTLVLWNDLPIQSPMLGLLDLTLLPTNIAESVEIQKGGGTAKWGSGAVGGVIGLNNKANYNNKIAVQSKLTIGSFGLFQQDLTAKTGTQKIQSHTKISYQKAENDFEYQPIPTLNRVNENAAFQQQNFLQDFYFRPNYHNQIATHFWYQKAERQIPPTTVQTRSLAYQLDEAFRLIVDYRFIKKSRINAKIGFFKEKLNYFDDIILLASYSDFSTVLGELDYQGYIGNKQKIYVGTTHTLTKVTADNYPSESQEYRAAIFVTHQWESNQWQTQTTLRQEMIDGVFVPITPMFGVEKRLKNGITFKGKVSRNYRLPTLNDRFWQPGGNPDLLPESGWSEEFTLAYEKQTKGLAVISANATVFNRNMNNWIMWSLVDNQQFWSANNITKVWSRGLESEARLSLYAKKDWKARISIGHNWVRSTNEVALSKPKIPKNQQLFYTPEHQFFGKIRMTWKVFNLSYYHNYTSSTFGVNEDLAAYNLGNFQFGYDYKLGNLKGNILFNIQNIWNTNYFIVERRPIAGRNFQVSFVVR